MLLCDAGFFYAGFSDCVHCFYCGGGLRNWEDEDIPWVEHARWYPNCVYLKRQKGNLFIQMHQQDGNQEPTCASSPPPSPSPRQALQVVTSKEMENPVPISSKEDEDIAFRSVLEMGYSKPKIYSAIEQLRKRGKSKYAAIDIMEIILEVGERQEASIELQTSPQTTGTSASQLSLAFAEYDWFTGMQAKEWQSLKKKNQTLKEQMVCKICLDKDACIVYLPCGHMVTCQDCAMTIRKCCICRKLIQRTVKVHL